MFTEKHFFGLHAALGYYFSFGSRYKAEDGTPRFDKVVLWPQPVVEQLGFVLDARPDERKILVPEKKSKFLIEKCRSLQEALKEEGGVTKRMFAQVAGVLISVQMAIPVAKLLAGDCVHAMAGRLKMEDVLNAENARDVLESILRALERGNGRRYYRLADGLQIGSDYSGPI